MYRGVIGAGAVLAASVPGRIQAAPPALAIVTLDYSDTSGEVHNQQAEHARRLDDFVASLRDDLTTNGRFRLVTLACPPAGCPTSSTPPDQLAAAAAQAGASHVLFGGIHKSSSLIQWARVGIIDVAQRKVIFDRLLTFRGDDDLAWQRAEKFLAREILQDPTFK